ncbi:MAG: amidohydrolase [Chloroflexi bacterium]|nr:amidohydrolase [Chloroflexota bacterium]
MIIDFHTHIFPPGVRDHRDAYLKRDLTFAEMYASPKAKVATAEDLLWSMEEADVDSSVACGFAWRDPELCHRHNDYLLEAAAASGGRLIAYCTLSPLAGETALADEASRCARAGARGLGELRPESQGWDLNGEEGRVLAEAAREYGLVLLFHVTEPGGREYAGKQGLGQESFQRFAADHPDLTIVGAHLGGGLPFQGSQALGGVYVDTAAAHLIYESAGLREAVRLAGAERILMGSDFPLVGQSKQIELVREAGLDAEAERLILGENARRLVGRGEARGK